MAMIMKRPKHSTTEDANKRAPELGLEFFDGLLIERRIILIELRDFLPAGWIVRIRAGLRRVRPLILLVFSETERSGSSSSSRMVDSVRSSNACLKPYAIALQQTDSICLCVRDPALAAWKNPPSVDASTSVSISPQFTPTGL
jgi:hypothetical protein